MIERESFWSKAALYGASTRQPNNTNISRALALSCGKGKRARRKRENCAKSREKRCGAHSFPVGVAETKNHPSKLYLNLKSIFRPIGSVWQNSIIFCLPRARLWMENYYVPVIGSYTQAKAPMWIKQFEVPGIWWVNKDEQCHDWKTFVYVGEWRMESRKHDNFRF